MKIVSLFAAVSLAVGVTLSGAVPVAASHGHDLDCVDFAYYDEALAHLQAHPGDPDGLDNDGDGQPCESLPRRPVTQPPPSPVPPAPPVGSVFTDVLPGGAHTEAIEAMAAAGVITGYGDGTFRPGNDVTRGQMASLLYRALDFPAGTASFTDTAGSPHQAAIAALASAGVVNGYADGTFRPGDPISRAQMASMIARAFRLPPAATSPFTDTAGNAHAAGIAALTAAGITSGYADGTFRPAQNTPRAQTASFLYRALQTAQPAPADGWTVTNVVDGDTLDATSSTGAVERVRLVGVDTPERGDCGFTEATSALAELTLGRRVTLVPGAQDDRDHYGRLLRYVDVDGTDAGLELIRAGLAIARYDSRDVYGPHPREASYISADVSAPNVCSI